MIITYRIKIWARPDFNLAQNTCYDIHLFLWYLQYDEVFEVRGAGEEVEGGEGGNIVGRS